MIKEIMTSAGKFIKDVSTMHVSNKSTTVDTYQVSINGNNIDIGQNYDMSIGGVYRTSLRDITRYMDKPVASIVPNTGDYAGQLFYFFFYGSGGQYGEGVSLYVIKASDVQLTGGVIKALHRLISSRFQRTEVAA